MGNDRSLTDEAFRTQRPATPSITDDGIGDEGLVERLSTFDARSRYVPGGHPILPVWADEALKEARLITAEAARSLADRDKRIGELEGKRDEAREAFLDMIADARDYRVEPDGDETGDHTHFIIVSHWQQFSRLAEAVGIKPPAYMQTWADAIDAALSNNLDGVVKDAAPRGARGRGNPYPANSPKVRCMDCGAEAHWGDCPAPDPTTLEKE